MVTGEEIERWDSKFWVARIGTLESAVKELERRVDALIDLRDDVSTHNVISPGEQCYCGACEKARRDAR